MRVLETDRLSLRRLTLDDAAFILELLNEPAFVRFIGDKGVRDLDDARNYLRTGPLDMYSRLGFGLLLVELKGSGEPIGTCGLIKRDILPDVDIGYAFLPAHWRRGYALEAAMAVLSYGHQAHRLKRILAIVSPDNDSSVRVLQKAGMKYERMMEMTEKDEVKVFAREFAAG
jgi:RimJ/RimL family protein N-acetyltransferase